MCPISIEIYSENATSGIFYKSALTQPWNTVHQCPVLCQFHLRNLFRESYKWHIFAKLNEQFWNIAYNQIHGAYFIYRCCYILT